MRFSGILILLLTASAALGGEFAVLSTGSRIRADRHETDGGKVRLYSGSGYIELDASQVTSFEAAPDPASSVPAPAVVPPPAPPTQSPAELAEAAAHKYGLPANLVRSVMAAESANRPTAISPKGAIGLMQLMPSTAKDSASTRPIPSRTSMEAPASCAIFS